MKCFIMRRGDKARIKWNNKRRRHVNWGDDNGTHDAFEKVKGVADDAGECI